MIFSKISSISNVVIFFIYYFFSEIDEDDQYKMCHYFSYLTLHNLLCIRFLEEDHGTLAC